MNRFFHFLNTIRPCINAKGINAAAGLPENTLGHHYSWAKDNTKGRPLPWEHWMAVAHALAKCFGCIQIGGTRYYADDQSPALFATTPIGEVEIVEYETHFDYIEHSSRTVYDAFDFYTDLRGDAE